MIYSTKQTPQRKVKDSTQKGVQKGYNQKGRVKEGHAASESLVIYLQAASSEYAVHWQEKEHRERH